MQRAPDLFCEISSDIALKIRLVISDFDGVFTDNSVWVDENGVEQVKCSRSDGIGIAKLKAIGVELVVVSTEPNNVVLKRCEKLRLEAYNNIGDKGSFVGDLLQRKKVEAGSTLFVGNDENDLPALQHVGFGVAVADSHEKFFKSSRYALKAKGGQGAIRELCEVLVQKRALAVSKVERSDSN